MNILLTGGAGYIGTHTLIQLVENGHGVVVADNFSNSSPEAIRRVEAIIGTSVPVYEIDVADQNALEQVFNEHVIDAVIHFAGLKAVGESVKQPLRYYRTNIDSTLSLLETMQSHEVKKLIFSSSATVYGTPSELPLTEESQTGVGITNPYGKTKYMIEKILQDHSVANPDMEITILRYFNPIGAHESGLIGEDPTGIPNNLLPFVAQVAIGKRDAVQVFGDDYNTVDGTGVRDYIHVLDLAKGHVAALEHSNSGAQAYNLGTGNGTSVLELIHAFENAAGKPIPYHIAPRRAGDIASCYASPEKAQKLLRWKAKKTIEDACVDSWRWQSRNPDGYAI